MPDESYSVSDIQDYFEELLRIYISKIENRIIFKLKSGYYLEILSVETMELLEAQKIS